MSFTLNHETLGRLGHGTASDKIDDALRQMIADTDRRGDDEATRKVIIEIDMHKTPEGEISFGYAVSWKMPKLSGPRVVGELVGAGINQRVEIEDESESERAA